MKTKTKKIMAMISLVLILLTSLPINTFANFITDINSNAQFGVISGSLANYGHELHYANYDGQTYIAFCTQYGMTSPNGGEYTYNGSFVAQYKNSLPQYEKIAEMIYFGYTMNYGYGIPQSADAIRAACCTQQYVWEYIHNHIDSSCNVPGRESWNGNYMSTGLLADWTARTEGYYNMYHGNTSFNGTTAKVTLGESTKITDSNGKLAAYAGFTHNVNGITFHHEQGSNDLIITASNDCTADSVSFKTRDYGLFQLMPNGTPYNSSTMSNYVYIKFTSGSVQNLIFSNYVDPSEFNINVQIEYGNAVLIKTNSVGNMLAGAKFGLYKDSNCTQIVRSGTSDTNGQIQFNRLAPGTYYVKELSVPTGYLLDTTIQSVKVKVNETSQVTFKNNEPTGELKLIKTDAETGNQNRIDGTSHHGDATINDTEYTVYAKEDIYNVAKTVKYFSANEEIATYKFDSNGIATINITTKSNNANLTTDKNVLKGLPMGNYYAKETKVPLGYLPDNETHSYSIKYKDMNTPIIKVEGTLNNTVQKAKFEVIKMSSITNTTAPIITDAEFTAILTKYVDYYGGFNEALKHLNEFSNDEYSIFKTETNGHGISGLLAYGKYTVNETYCPSDEINPVQEFYVEIDKNSNGVIKELVENDTPFQSFIKMIKVDKKTGKTVTFSNTTFSLYKLNTTSNEWEKVKCKVGKTSYDTWTTDENAVAYTETKLDVGKYKIDEIVVPDGFLQLDEECIFDVNRSNNTLEYDKDFDAYITIKVGNEQPTGTLLIDKSIAIRDNVDTSLIDISDLSEIEFKLSAKEKIIDYADGSTIYEKGQEVGIYNLDKDGNLKVDNLPMGIYELQEIKTLKGLVLDNKKYKVEFKQEDLVKKVYTKTKELINDTTIFEFSKTDITGDKELEGAKLTILDKNGTIIDSWTSGRKSHKIEGLSVGEKYILREEIAPNGYVKATDITFEVKNTKEVQKINMIDKVVEITKNDLVTGDEIEGAELQVIDKDGNVIDEWTSTKNAHVVNGLEEGKKYKLIEKTAPYGYELTEEIEFEVTTDKETQLVEMKDMPILNDITLIKIDADTKAKILDKFTFGLYAYKECTQLIQQVDSNKDEGTITFKDLRYGIYYIKEITAPKGYKKSDKVVKIEINDKGIFVDGKQIEKDNDEIYSFEFEDQIIETPKTGDDGHIKIWFAVLGISLFALLGIIIYFKKFLK